MAKAPEVGHLCGETLENSVFVDALTRKSDQFPMQARASCALVVQEEIGTEILVFDGLDFWQ